MSAESIERKRASSRRHYQLHKEECVARSKKWRAAHPHKAKEYSDRAYNLHRDEYIDRSNGYSRLRRKYINTLKTYFGGCVDCGYNENPTALEFDHLPGSKKIKSISQLHRAPWYKLLTEMSKCEVVCANCHAIRTTDRLDRKDC